MGGSVHICTNPTTLWLKGFLANPEMMSREDTWPARGRNQTPHTRFLACLADGRRVASQIWEMVRQMRVDTPQTTLGDGPVETEEAGEGMAMANPTMLHKEAVEGSGLGDLRPAVEGLECILINVLSEEAVETEEADNADGNGPSDVRVSVLSVVNGPMYVRVVTVRETATQTCWLSDVRDTVRDLPDEPDGVPQPGGNRVKGTGAKDPAKSEEQRKQIRAAQVAHARQKYKAKVKACKNASKALHHVEAREQVGLARDLMGERPIRVKRKAKREYVKARFALQSSGS